MTTTQKTKLSNINIPTKNQIKHFKKTTNINKNNITKKNL